MDYSGLISAVTDWSARTDLSTSTLAECVGFAEEMFNHGFPAAQIAALRLREMQAIATITITDGTGPLPADYLQYLSVKSDASTPRPLQNVTTTFSDIAYADGSAGLSNYFSIVGDEINVFPPNSTNVTMLYFQKIPALSEANTTNWLIVKRPSLYLHAVLMHIGLYIKDNELAQRSQALVASAIDGLNETNMLSQYASTGTRMRTLTP